MRAIPRRNLALFATLALVATLAPAAQVVAAGRDIGTLPLFHAGKFTAHLVVPRDDVIRQTLVDAQVIVPGMAGGAQDGLIAKYKEAFLERNPDTPNPIKLKSLLDAERSGVPGAVAADASTMQSLVVPVEFSTTPETFDYCETTFTGAGPLHNQIAAPGPRDNNTVWYDDTTPAMYDQLYFETGPTAGVIVHHPNLGTVDLRGSTMANYYLEQSEGQFQPHGAVYPKWLQSAHSEVFYGADCGDSHYRNPQNLVVETVGLINADNASFNWQQFDGDGNGIVDNFTVIHAGMGQEAGGGAQGADALWSHASSVGWPTGILACTAGSAGCPDRDVYVREYSMDPENIDVGVISEEYGHAAFGLPDLYTTDAQQSISNWAIMEAGSWNGILGGMQPAPFPLWFRTLVGWASPTEVPYDTSTRTVRVGQLSIRPGGTASGIRVDLPDKTVQYPNPLGSGIAWWSTTGDLADYTLTRTFDLTGATSPVLSFNSYWSIEEDWDYGYVEISDDGGASWDMLVDTGGHFRTTNPNGNNQGVGLTGEAQGGLAFDLSGYAGTTVLVRLRYSTDMAVQWGGWYADDFQLADGAAVLWSDNLESGNVGWATNAWTFVPKADYFPRYYLAEWRNMSGFDRGLQYPYATVYSDADEWEVDRAPYTVPGMLLYLRDTSYNFDYNLYNAELDPPSLGPKHGLIVIDSHYWPYEWSNWLYTWGAHARVNSRVQPGNATFTLQPTTPFTLRLGYDPTISNPPYLDQPIDQQTFGPLPAVSQFHDSLGYYPGLWYRPATGGLYYWDRPASAVVPAQGTYTTRITDVNRNPYTSLYGATVAGLPLGSGNPGDEGVQFGVNMAVKAKAPDGSWGDITVWNSGALTSVQVVPNRPTVRYGDMLTYTITVRNRTPATQPYVLDDPIPSGTAFLYGSERQTTPGRFQHSGTLGAYATASFSFTVSVRVRSGTIVNTATVTDGALGSTSTASTPVVRR